MLRVHSALSSLPCLRREEPPLDFFRFRLPSPRLCSTMPSSASNHEAEDALEEAEDRERQKRQSLVRERVGLGPVGYERTGLGGQELGTLLPFQTVTLPIFLSKGSA